MGGGDGGWSVRGVGGIHPPFLFVFFPPPSMLSTFCSAYAKGEGGGRRVHLTVHARRKGGVVFGWAAARVGSRRGRRLPTTAAAEAAAGARDCQTSYHQPSLATRAASEEGDLRSWRRLLRT